ncbi:hypothetical protein X797_010249 [Metarhizium robertsii]|uniref:Uncharacterized protein n=2 Tax=Metarhizium robertsii TaxID=568076 RepID=E9FCY6_METRA|nr:uncharacterized protein MAA_10135 [Metarhizium robertsii ARSEF 23]EFY94408.2 hypothetical protein MAA_10135 [Metarhizium robertsii ARSEF 23]EXU96704.1 hypothetical protein X797_010249 [Metarhizium robertsii]
MSSINDVRFFIYPNLSPKKPRLLKLVNLAYLTARDKTLYPKEILIRSDLHCTTKIGGKYRTDPKGPHLTMCYKDEGQVQRGTHVASHGYVRSMTDWTFVSASHDPEKLDTVMRPNGKGRVWPPYELLTDITSIAHSHWAGQTEDWAQVSENSPAEPFDQTAYYSLTAATASMSVAGESSQAGTQENQESVIVDIKSDTYVVVEKKDGNKFKLRLHDESTTKTQATGWQDAHVFYGESWAPCYLYVGQVSGTRYWTWTLEVSKKREGKGKTPKGKGTKKGRA